jgi:hypothetical protein
METKAEKAHIERAGTTLIHLMTILLKQMFSYNTNLQLNLFH